MKSLKELYKIGPGPSSSHTLAVERACLLYKEKYPSAESFDVHLYNSLALTARGHHTDQIIVKAMAPFEVNVILENEPWRHQGYATAMDIIGKDKNQNIVEKWEVASVGGGSIVIFGHDFGFEDIIYPHASFEEIKQDAIINDISLYEYVLKYEADDIHEYFEEIVDQMLLTVKTGLDSSGILPGRLKIKRVAGDLMLQSHAAIDQESKRKLKLIAYAYAAAEENAAGGHCVTAPTMGASGVLAAIVYHYYYDLNFDKQQIIEGLLVGGLFGNVIKNNASISGAVGGCQAEIGTACAMASAFIAYLDGCEIDEIEYAAEIAIEHHLGLTCDPVGGYVIIPCIERNAVATLRSFDHAFLSKQLSAIRMNRVSYDSVVNVMNYTGEKIIPELKETSLGGLATEIKVEE